MKRTDARYQELAKLAGMVESNHKPLQVRTAQIDTNHWMWGIYAGQYYNDLRWDSAPDSYTSSSEARIEGQQALDDFYRATE